MALIVGMATMFFQNYSVEYKYVRSTEILLQFEWHSLLS